MKRWIAVLVCAVAGCAGAPRHGTFVQGQDAALGAVSEDAAGKLRQEFPPDRYAVVLERAEEDAFGKELDSALRKAGYEVLGKRRKGGQAVRVRYAVDTVKETMLLRLTMEVGRQQLSRVYVPRSRGVYPAGPWSAAVPR